MTGIPAYRSYSLLVEGKRCVPKMCWKQTCPLKRDYFSREYLFQPLIFRGHSLVFRGLDPLFCCCSQARTTCAISNQEATQLQGSANTTRRARHHDTYREHRWGVTVFFLGGFNLPEVKCICLQTSERWRNFQTSQLKRVYGKMMKHEWYCWWFRNPAITTWDENNLVNNGG